MSQCPSCDGANARVWLDGFVHTYKSGDAEKQWPYRLLECGACGLGFIDPMPDWQLMQTFYSERYHCYGDGFEVDPDRRKYGIARMRFAAPTGARTAPAAWLRLAAARSVEWTSGKTISYSLGLPLQLPHEAMIFEMGYGTGYWLRTMSALGYRNLYGYDIDANPANAGQLESIGVRVSAGVFLDNDYPQGAFDCVRLEHVFEHLLHPVEVLGKCRAMLKPGGWLVMTFPCKASWSCALSARHWGALEPPVHLYHHTPASARLILEKAGLKPVKIRPFAVTDQLAGTVNNLLAARPGRRFAVGGLASRALAPLYRLLCALTGRGDFMTVWAERGT